MFMMMDQTSPYLDTDLEDMDIKSLETSDGNYVAVLMAPPALSTASYNNATAFQKNVLNSTMRPDLTLQFVESQVYKNIIMGMVRSNLP